MRRIVEGGLDDSRVIALLHHHADRARAETAQGSSHALDLAGLSVPDIRFWSIWNDGVLLGVGAIKRLPAGEGEIKSMHIAEAARRTGAGSDLLRHMFAAALADGLKRLCLETGSWDYFHAARAFYARHGFIACPPFAGYAIDPHSVFMTREL